MSLVKDKKSHTFDVKKRSDHEIASMVIERIFLELHRFKNSKNLTIVRSLQENNIGKSW
jgi:hypothetical protein